MSRTEPSGDQVVDYFAQDRRGNVWWFGREGEWLAGEDGAQAGLAMPATPRLGDGWRAAYEAGVVDVRMTVTSRDQSVDDARGHASSRLVGLDITSPLEPGHRARGRLRARGRPGRGALDRRPQLRGRAAEPARLTYWPTPGGRIWVVSVPGSG